MKIIDDYITGEEVRASLRHAWGGLSESDTAWVDYIDAVEKPGNVWETLAADIWKEHLSSAPLGYEYWGNTIEPGQVLDWHKDKDEVAYNADPSKTTCPTIGAIYYPFDDAFEGGFLEVALEDDFDRIERFEAKPNRLIIFNPSSYHRVSKVYSGRRKAFVVNVWQDHLPAVASAGNVYPHTAFGKLYHNGL